MKENGVLTVVRHGCLCKQDVTLPWHTPGNGMNGEANFDALGTQHVRDLGQSVLRLCDGHAVANNLQL